MWIKCYEEYRDKVIEFLSSEFFVNIFMISNIKNFGFENKNFEIWLNVKDNHIIATLSRYYCNLNFYACEFFEDYSKVYDILNKYKITNLTAKEDKIRKLKSSLNLNGDIVNLDLMIYEGKTKIRDYECGEIHVAKIEDSLDIAKKYRYFPEFKNLYTNDYGELAKQIEDRIKSHEGLHVIIKDKDDIIAHGNTTAQNNYSGIIGGLFVDYEYRRQGYGTKILRYLINNLVNNNQKPCLLNGDGKIKKFFEANDFSKIDIISTLRRSSIE